VKNLHGLYRNPPQNDNLYVIIPDRTGEKFGGLAIFEPMSHRGNAGQRCQVVQNMDDPLPLVPVIRRLNCARNSPAMASHLRRARRARIWPSLRLPRETSLEPVAASQVKCSLISTGSLARAECLPENDGRYFQVQIQNCFVRAARFVCSSIDTFPVEGCLYQYLEVYAMDLLR